MTLLEFLKARLDEDERKACAASDGPWRYNERKYHHLPGTSLISEAVFAGPAGPDALCVATTGDYDDPQSMRDADHIARHDPARVLREVESKRRLLDEYAEYAENDTDKRYEYADGWANGLGFAVRLLTLTYSDHEDYQEAWRV